MKFGKVFGLILVGVIFATGCGKTDFEKLQAATEGKYFDSKETDGKVLFVPLRTNVKVIRETVNDPKMAFLGLVDSFSIGAFGSSVTFKMDKIKEVMPAWCIGSFEQRTDEEKNICSQLFALALKMEGGKDGKSVDFVDYFPSKHDAELIALSDKIGELLIAKKLDAAEREIKKLGKNFRRTDRAGIAERGADVSRAFALALRGNGEEAKRIIEHRFLKKNLFNFLLNGRRPAFAEWKREMVTLSGVMMKNFYDTNIENIENIMATKAMSALFTGIIPNKQLELICRNCLRSVLDTY